jgi:methylglyoxal synthase
MTQAIEKAATKSIALVAHDHKKKDLLDWSGKHCDQLKQFNLYATGTTGKMITDRLGLAVNSLQSGPLGGDQQLGALIAENRIDILVFFWDPLEPQPHDPDVKALLRLAVVWNIPVACNLSTADLLFASPLLIGDYKRSIPDFELYKNRRIT